MAHTHILVFGITPRKGASRGVFVPALGGAGGETGSSDFLGSVNMFHGRVEGDKVFIGTTEIQTEDAVDKTDEKAVVCFRPHLLDLSEERTPNSLFQARVIYLNVAGPLVKVELESDSGDLVHVEMTQDRYRELGFGQGRLLFVVPKNSENGRQGLHVKMGEGRP